MLAKLNTFALVGIDAVPVEVEVDNSFAQMPKTVIVGLPEGSVRESIHRIERAICNLNYHLPDGRTVINLAPAGWTREKDVDSPTAHPRPAQFAREPASTDPAVRPSCTCSCTRYEQ
jgi:hypothetical protein